MSAVIATTPDSLPATQGDGAAILRELLDYCPDTGVFTWKSTRGRLARKGDIAGTDVNGRWYIKVNGKFCIAARLAFLIMTGRLPSGCVDHVDGNPRNNAWGNLRECSHAENMQNKRAYKNNQSGLIGVSPAPKGCSRPWRATIKVDGKCRHLGLFDTAEDAHKAYLDAKAELHKFNPVARN